MPPDARVCGDCGELVRGTSPSGALQDPAPVYATTDLKVGDVVEGKWRLDEIVGRGGMGAVFAATELGLGRKVAVKALSANLAGEEFVSRFEREARVLGILHHPNIVTLHWVGRHNGVPFIVMNYLEGDPLRRWVELQGGRVSVEGLLQIARPMCSALSYVHSKGVIHRDLKPSNIIVAPNGHVTVFDLGIARPHDSQLTKTGIIFGTPGYMSPELIVGEKTLDGRLDLYALAVILYEIVTGQSPFSERHEESLLRAHLMKPRPDASQVRTDLPPELGKVLQKAMALDPKDRYPDCDEFLAAMETACGKRVFHEAATIMRVPLSRDALAKAPPPPGMLRAEPPPAPPAQVERESTRIERGARAEAQSETDSTRLARGARGDPPPETDSTRLARGARTESPPPETDSTRLARGPRTESPPPETDSTRLARGPRTESPPETDSTRLARGSAARPARSASSSQVPQTRGPSSRASKAQARSASSAAVPRSQARDQDALPAPRRTGEARARRQDEEALESDELEHVRPSRTGVKVLAAVVLVALIAAAAFVLGRQGAMPTTPTPKAAATPATAPDPVTIAPKGAPESRAHVKKTTTTFAGARKGYGELQLDVTLKGQPVRAKVMLDGDEVGQAPLATPAKAGVYKVRIAHEGAPDATFTAHLTGGTSLHYEVELDPAN